MESTMNEVDTCSTKTDDVGTFKEEHCIQIIARESRGAQTSKITKTSKTSNFFSAMF